MAIVLRNTKGSALTYAELDGNFTDLNGRVLDSDGIRTLVDSDYVTARATQYSGFDSDFGTKTTTNLTEGTNLYYTTARHDSDFNVSLGASTTTDLPEGQNLYYTTARFDSDLGTKTTDDITEGSFNLFYTTVRFNADLATKDTDDLDEGNNRLYYTTARHDSDFAVSLNAATLGYTTDSATLWNGSAPTTVDSALDRIALLVRTLNGGTGA